MRARRIEFLETKAIQSAYQINPQRQSVRKEERTESVPLQIPQTTKLHVILNERSLKKRHAHFQTPSDLRGVLNQIFATTKTYSTRGFTHRNHSFKNNNQKRKLRQSNAGLILVMPSHQDVTQICFQIRFSNPRVGQQLQHLNLKTLNRNMNRTGTAPTAKLRQLVKAACQGDDSAYFSVTRRFLVGSWGFE